MLEQVERPDPAEIEIVQKLIEGLDDDISQKNLLNDVFQSWINSIPESGGYDDTTAHIVEYGSTPKISFSPALILRKRTEKSLARSFREIIEQIKKADNLTEGTEALVKDPDKEQPGDLDDNIHPFREEDVYFPLPANHEQIEIARQLQFRKGILVQGPPETGKSHTIANLICHLLAEGKRVLVTSHTSRALVVLRDKLPKEVKQLCVIALGEDAKSLKALEESVSGITSRHNSWNPRAHELKINQHRIDLDRYRQEEAKTLSDLRAIRESETYTHSDKFGSYSGKLTDIATQLNKEETVLSWLPDNIDEENEPPLNDREAGELFSLITEISLEMETVASQYIPDLTMLPTLSEFERFVEEEKKALNKKEKFSEIRKTKEYSVLIGASEEPRSEINTAFSNLLLKIDQISNDAYSWAPDILTKVLSNQHLPLLELLEISKKHIDEISALLSRVAVLQISGIENCNRSMVEGHARAIIDHLENGGGLGWWKLRSGVVREGLYLIKNVRINGSLCDNSATLLTLVDWCVLKNRFDALELAWSAYYQEIPATLPSVLKAEYENRAAGLERCLSIVEEIGEAKRCIALVTGLAEPSWHLREKNENILDVLEAIDSELVVRSYTDRLNDLAAIIRKGIDENLGISTFAKKLLECLTQRDCVAYRERLLELKELVQTKEKALRKQELLGRIEQKAPNLAVELFCSSECISSDKMSEFTAAWNWSRADKWLSRMSSPGEQENLARNIAELRSRIQNKTKELAAELAWKHCLSRMTEHESGHLRAWQLAVKRIGKGTGKEIYVNAARREARNHLEQCRSAIPAWIMPFYRVAETVEMKPDIFDVVIVDEASQSGPEALLLQYIAKKIVVVGDNKQISPQFIGMNKDTVNLMRAGLIRDIPFCDTIGITNSFFDLASVRYKSQICLREHFRCMPEIIQFSNNLCYSATPLIPLKQYGAGRLSPTVMTKYVSGGYQKGTEKREINKPEAQALVDFVEQCRYDERYKSKTFGVIGVLGTEQSKLISSMLLERIGPQEFEKRQLVCGNAYAFQGDERDVMFLSMVTAPTDEFGKPVKFATLGSDDYQKIYNVAASRAKEQMILFHTVTLNDLSTNCYRYKLLEYCLNPKVETSSIGIDIDRLRELARTVNRNVVKPSAPFDSWFEVDVYLDIISRGYRVIPQFEVAGYRIDMVVEGMRGRLAVECDGDQWHGAEEYEYDMSRQRQLERSGYVFWRVRGSAYYREPSKAMQSLWSKLADCGIFSTAEEDRNNKKIIERSSNSELQPSHEAITVVEQSNTADKAPEQPDITILDASEVWQDVLKKLHLMHKRLVEECAKYAKLEITDANSALIVFDKSHIFFKERLEKKDYRDVVERALRIVLKKDVDVLLVLEDELSEQRKKTKAIEFVSEELFIEQQDKQASLFDDINTRK